MKMKIVSLMILSSLISLQPVRAEKVGNGGTILGQEVAAVADDILEQSDLSQLVQTTIDYPAFKAKVLKVQLKLVKELPTCMANYPGDNRIEFTQSCWDSLGTYADKKRMVLHELLGVTNNEASESYQLTDLLIKSISCGIVLMINFDTQNKIDLVRELVAKKGYKIASAGAVSDYYLKASNKWVDTSPDYDGNQPAKIFWVKNVSAALSTSASKKSDQIWYHDIQNSSFLSLKGWHRLISEALDNFPESSCK